MCIQGLTTIPPEKCPTCGGLGWEPIDWVRYVHWEECPDCNPDGKIPYPKVDAVGELISDKCPKCIDVRIDCPDCTGEEEVE